MNVRATPPGRPASRQGGKSRRSLSYLVDVGTDADAHRNSLGSATSVSLCLYYGVYYVARWMHVADDCADRR